MNQTSSPIFFRHRIRKRNTCDPVLATCYDWVGSFVAALLCVIVVFTFVFRVVRVSGDSMLPTLTNNDTLIISSMGYQPQTGDIVVLQVPTYKNGLPLIKRVIATGGQRVQIDFENWKITVDGVTLDETYINRVDDWMDQMHCPEDFVVEEGCVFVMGDNRNFSSDSRNRLIGQVDQRYILGKVVFRLFSISPFGTDANPLLTPFEKVAR